MNKVEKEKAMSRNMALYSCTAFDCKRSRDRKQCCDYCFYVPSCKKRCQNDSVKCGRLYISEELFESLPQDNRRLENDRKKIQEGVWKNG